MVANVQVKVESNEHGDNFLSFLNTIGLPTEYKTEGYFYRNVKPLGEFGGSHHRPELESIYTPETLPLVIFDWGNIRKGARP